ncbi:transient receptor potential cation channel subfamily A member 1-like isoform X2 [Eriocheir sinensis]|uniref:transient receptor potential cation channel subfamily A member 1-like isoform X2 n=1 Tax=Eriocheir sinensis TaxID=95602 RepID=UPI0021CA92A4|nr:transient receptor potential cation channel subfamily A member 1-like isoform X2 [Eriocheir sinensis]
MDSTPTARAGIRNRTSGFVARYASHLTAEAERSREDEQQQQRETQQEKAAGRMEGQQDAAPAPQPQDVPDAPGAAANGRKSSVLASLHAAIAKEDVEQCLRLLENERNVNVLDDRDGSTPLHTLARRKWSDGRRVAEALLARGAKVNTKDHAGHTPLHIVARDGRGDLCECLLAHHEATGSLNLNVRRKCTQRTPLHYAAEEGQAKIVELLLSAGADAKLQDKSGLLPVHYAAKQGYKECCSLLASSYSHPGPSNVPPPLALTLHKGHYRCCKELKPDEASLRYRDNAGNTPLHVVAKRGYNVFVEVLLDMKAPVDERNESGNTPLMEAVRHNKLPCVKLLVEGGASLAEINRENSTVLHLAAVGKAHKCLEYLLGCRNIEDQLNKKDARGHTALSIATEKQDEKSFNLLIEAGASPTCGPGKPLLHFHSVYRRPGILKKMLSCDSSDTNISDEKGVTPLHLAAKEGSIVVCGLLLGRGARLNATDNNGKSPLHVAAAAGHAELVRLLVNRGATLRAKERDTNFTALHAAAAVGSLECAKILLNADHGLGNEKDAKSKYALDVAFEGGHHEVVRLLLEDLKTLPEDLRPRLHEYTHQSVAKKDRGFLSVMFESKWWEAGCGLDRAEGATHCPNFRDIISPYPEIASEVMTKCRNDEGINDFRLLENTSYAKTVAECLEGSRQEPAERACLADHPVGVMAGSERLALLQHPPLLQHPLVEKWLEYKWCSYARWLFLALLLWRLVILATLFFFLLHTTNWTQIEKMYNLTREEICGPCLEGEAAEEQEEQEECVPAFWTHPGVPGTVIAHLLLTASLLLQVFVESTCFRKMRKHYLDNSFFLLRLPWMVMSLAALLPTSQCDLILGIKSVYAWECGILALLFSWLDLIHNIDLLLQFIMFAALNANFLKEYIKGLMYFGMIVFIFSFAFHLLLWEQASFHSLPQSMVQVVVWMVGDLNYDDNFLNANLDYPLLSNSLFLLFVCTVGAFFVTLLKTPSFSKKRLCYLKQTGRINLLLKIDMSFPWCRLLCFAQKYDEKEKIPSLITKVQEKYAWPPGEEENGQNEVSQVDGSPRDTGVSLYLEKVMSFVENVVDFFQTDDNDDDESDDDDIRANLKLMRGMLEEQAKQLQEVTNRCADILEYYDERSEASLQMTNTPKKCRERCGVFK